MDPQDQMVVQEEVQYQVLQVQQVLLGHQLDQVLQVQQVHQVLMELQVKVVLH